MGHQLIRQRQQMRTPDAIQISDRFHLIKGLSEAINKYMIREFPARVEIPATENNFQRK